jgi:hypothetical protein
VPQAIKFKMPNTFEVTYDPKKISVEKITSLEIFKTFKPTIGT